MEQQQLVFADATEAPRAAPEGGSGPPTAPGGESRRPAARHREELLTFLDRVTQGVREAASLGEGGAVADPRARTRLRNTVENGQMIAARARRVIDALPGTDLGLLRAHGRLLAATREAHEARLAADFLHGALAAPGGQVSPRLTERGARNRARR